MAGELLNRSVEDDFELAEGILNERKLSSMRDVRDSIEYLENQTWDIARLNETMPDPMAVVPTR